MPVLELLERLKPGPGVVAIEGVMNGTANFLLSRMGEGWTLEDAVQKAQELGYAEADPAADLDGHDAADKLSILVREAFGVALPPGRIFKHRCATSRRGDAQAALAKGQVLKQVARAGSAGRGGQGRDTDRGAAGVAPARRRAQRGEQLPGHRPRRRSARGARQRRRPLAVRRRRSSPT